MESVQEVKAYGYLRLNEERRVCARKLRRLLLYGILAYAMAAGLVVWFVMEVLR